MNTKRWKGCSSIHGRQRLIHVWPVFCHTTTCDLYSVKLRSLNHHSDTRIMGIWASPCPYAASHQSDDYKCSRVSSLPCSNCFHWKHGHCLRSTVFFLNAILPQKKKRLIMQLDLWSLIGHVDENFFILSVCLTPTPASCWENSLSPADIVYKGGLVFFSILFSL